MQIPLLGRTAQGKYPLNLYYQPERGDQRAALIGTPGLKLFSNPGYAGAVRQMIEFNGYLYAVIKDTVYKITTSGAYAALSSKLNTTTGHVWMAKNTTQIMIVDGSYGYIIASDVLTEIADTDLPAPAALTYQDTYFIVIAKTSGRFYISASNDGTTWDALDFANPEGDPDISRSIISDHRELWICGDRTTEVYYNSGASDFPFSRIEGAFIEKGIGAAGTLVKLDNSVFWLTDKFQVVRAAGYVPEIISTRMIEQEIELYNTKDDAIAFGYEQAGHTFYVLIFPTANKTWVFDSAVKRWHRRGSGLLGGRHKANCYCHFDKKHLIGDFENGKIYQLDLETFDDDGDLMKAQHIFPPVFGPNREMLFHHRLEIECSTGIGLVTGQGSDPVAILDWTNDQYKTWSNEHWLKMGQIGEYTARVIKRQIGASRWRAYRLTITDPVERVIISPYLDASKGDY